MRVIETRFLRGPNIFTRRPVFVAVMDLEELEDRPSTDFPYLVDDLCEALPGLVEHRCSPGYRGGFIERLREGTYMAHITEHVMIELQCLAGTEVSFGRSRQIKDRPGWYTVAVAYQIEQVVEEALEMAVRLVERLCRGKRCDVAEDVADLRDLVDRYGLGPSTRAIVETALERDIPTFRLTEDASLFQLGWGLHQRRIQATMTSHTGQIAVEAACDKELTKSLLRDIGLPVPAGQVVRSVERALRVADRLGGPVVVKPLHGNQGKAVSVCLTTSHEIKQAVELAQVHGDAVLVEQCVPGDDYRVLVVGDSVVAAAKRRPAQVVGDGRHTIAQLVELENLNPLRGEGHALPMTRIQLDAGSQQVLARQNLCLEDVPAQGQTVILKENANLSTGGSAEDVTDLIHPENRAVCVRAAQQIGLDVAGIDVVCHDIRVPLSEQQGAIVEVNAAPGIRMHLHPSLGPVRDVGSAIVDHLFPDGGTGRIPLIAVTGTNGKTTTTRLIGHILSLAGLTTGMTTTEGVYVNEQRLQSGDCTGFWSARSVLTHPKVEAAVLEVARGGILRRGLAFDRSDVAVVLNVHDDHLGQDGIETVEDLAWVKQLLVETAGRAVVLNAEDPLTVDMAVSRAAGVEVLYFALRSDAPELVHHLAQGGRGSYLQDGCLVLAQGNQRLPLAAVDQIPFTWKGTARHNIANALAAVAALWAAGVSREVIQAGLQTFTSNWQQNPGRMNQVEMGDFTVLVDYAHNAESYRALIATLRQLPHQRLVGVITAPGDRQDDKLVEMGRLCGLGFDTLIIREMDERRGRQPGEVARLLRQGAELVGHGDVQVVLDEGAAVAEALSQARPGDYVVITCADTKLNLSQVLAYQESLPQRGAVPA